jgi:hypothetical protein
LWQVYEELLLVIAPQLHELQSGMRTVRQILAQNHPRNQGHVLLLLTRLSTSVKVVAPVDWLLLSINELLLQAEPFHIGRVLDNVLQDAPFLRVDVVVVDIFQHGVDQLLNALSFDGVNVARHQLYDVGQPVLADWRDRIDRNVVFQALAMASVRIFACLGYSFWTVLLLLIT